MRTWGGVIGINPYHRLVDGTLTTQPEYSFWFSDVGWNVENYGTDPDVEVDIAPHESMRGVDPQMERALELIMAGLRDAPERPPFGPRPHLPLPAGGRRFRSESHQPGLRTPARGQEGSGVTPRRSGVAPGGQQSRPGT
jgi:hypothetical protein